MYANQTLYKGRYFIVFYASDDDTFLKSFDNLKAILKYQGKEVNRKNLQNLTRQLYYALNSNNHRTKMLNGHRMYVYIIEAEENEEGGQQHGLCK